MYGLPGGLVVKNLPASARDMGLIWEDLMSWGN